MLLTIALTIFCTVQVLVAQYHGAQYHGALCTCAIVDRAQFVPRFWSRLAKPQSGQAGGGRGPSRHLNIALKALKALKVLKVLKVDRLPKGFCADTLKDVFTAKATATLNTKVVVVVR